MGRQSRQTLQNRRRLLGFPGFLPRLCRLGCRLSRLGWMENFSRLERREPQVKGAAEREHNFELFDFGICDGDICGEASRCLQCDLRLQIHRPRLWTDFENQEASES